MVMEMWWGGDRRSGNGETTVERFENGMKARISSKRNGLVTTVHRPENAPGCNSGGI